MASLRRRRHELLGHRRCDRRDVHAGRRRRRLTLRVLVTASNAAGSASATSSASGVVAAAPPVNTALPIVSGTARDGQTLVTSNGAWTGTPPLTYTYQWRRCDAAGNGCADIAGATGGSYLQTPADVGATLRVVVTATNAGGTAARDLGADRARHPGPAREHRAADDQRHRP